MFVRSSVCLFIRVYANVCVCGCVYVSVHVYVFPFQSDSSIPKVYVCLKYLLCMFLRSCVRV